jgi:hypothetical protein
MDRRQGAPKINDDVEAAMRFSTSSHSFLEQHHHDDAASWVCLVVVVFLGI